MSDSSREYLSPFSELDFPSSIVDIYTIDQPRYSVYTAPVPVDYCIPDDSNHILIAVQEALDKQIPLIEIHTPSGSLAEMMCSNCLRTTIYMRKLDQAWLCPPCFLTQANKQDGVRASCCDNPLGCDSCGGISQGIKSTKGMMEISDEKYGDLFLCARDECLLPFGYYIMPLYHKVACTCEYDFLKVVSHIIGRDLNSIVTKYLAATHPTQSTRYEGISADLRPIYASRCLHCQLTANNQTVSRSWLVDGKAKVCSCSTVFWGRRGRGSLSTLNTPSRRRRKSSGDLTDEYTPSTSEIW